MESLSDTKWDVVISGTGLQQSLLALALSRSGKNILHVDSNEYYGDAEAAFSLQEVDEWVAKNQSPDFKGTFAGALLKKQSEGLSFSRAHSIALAPQLIHTKSELLSQLVSSKAFRQVEFLAVGSFYIYHSPSDSSSAPSLSRIPSTREDVFSNTSIPARSKRSLMKFLKSVLDYDSDSQAESWKLRAEQPFAEFLASEFKLDASLQAYIIALTLSLDGIITVGDGLATIYRHMSSMGLFGAGFAAVYPKWGGLSEVAQVGCRAGAVGGAVYMLGTGITNVKRKPPNVTEPTSELEIVLSNDIVVQAKTLVQASAEKTSKYRLSRLTTIVDSGLSFVFKAVIEDAPTPAVAVVAFPAGSVLGDDGEASKFPIYAMLHSSDTGECPPGQCVIYLSTILMTNSRGLLDKALTALLATSSDRNAVKPLYQLYYKQRDSPSSVNFDNNIIGLPALSLDVAFNDSVMDHVRAAWDAVTRGNEQGESEYMKFENREGAVDDDDRYE